MALAHPTCALQLRRNGRLSRHYEALNTLQARLEQVCGPLRVQTGRFVQQRAEGVDIQGWVLTQACGVQGIQYLFVNGRIVKDRVVCSAVRQACYGVDAASVAPVFVLFLTLSPQLVDVNVHPTKESVRFAHPRQIYDAVYTAVRQPATASIVPSTDLLRDRLQRWAPAVAPQVPPPQAPLGQLVALYQARYALLERPGGCWVMLCLRLLQYWVEVALWLRPGAVALPLAEPLQIEDTWEHCAALETLGFELQAREGGVWILALPSKLFPHWSRFVHEFLRHRLWLMGTDALVQYWVRCSLPQQPCFSRTDALALLDAFARHSSGLPRFEALCVPLDLQQCRTQLQQCWPTMPELPQ